MKLPNIVVRFLAGAVFISLLLGGMLINEYSFLIVFSLITVLCLYEFYGLVEKDAKVPVIRTWNILGGFFLFVGGFYYCVYSSTAIAFIPYIIYLITLFISELYLKRSNPIQSLAYSLLGQLYIAAPMALTNYLVFAYQPGSYHYVYILALLVFIWVNDTFAYLTGMAFGKHRLFERISPKKSWEGFIGGAIVSICSSLIFAYFFPNLSTIAWLGFAAVTVVCGTWGDLFESLIKRTLGVKDSGTMIPGHGGILDRFDSTILAIPSIFVYLIIISI
ncbi:phosphatidate cytidylyltransferase [Dysgonomonas sp. Marseille-P4677]|uniref:phosphatidate cytidylyltransferase n=1 Tax=Dysgonomonas sp. Marseille-P4677 TaxID=2364790 RepID=UPI001914BFBF|nr:phosphatidate cytidylyltransferase [Dysgonomonas sp. Marseille-P4677]MBK5721130.1 phosphatidate cytidylyltransferase [Dysgonomonas sp. Marseille-P4677]